MSVWRFKLVVFHQVKANKRKAENAFVIVVSQVFSANSRRREKAVVWLNDGIEEKNHLRLPLGLEKDWQVKVFRALYTFEPRTPDELYFEEGDIIYISDMSDTNWWKGTCKGRTGLIPSNYVAEQAESIDNPLHEAAKRGNLSWLRECLDNRVGVNGLDKAGNTALYWACHGGHKDVVDVLFTQENLELNQQNKLGDTALHAAAWKGYADIVEMLLAKGARTDLKNNEKKLAIDMATNAACASLLKKKQSAGTVRTSSNAEEYLDDEDSD
nr:PREDICTED: osteoclast-stimulating factor 1 [Phalacrocorax carbo]